MTVDVAAAGARDTSDARCSPARGCVTCGDEAVSMEVLRVDEVRSLALCADAEGRTEAVEVALVDAAPGDRLLVHAGTALLLEERASPAAPLAAPGAPAEAPR